MFVAGAAVEWRRTVTWGAATLAGYYTLIVIILMNGYATLGHFTEYGTYEILAEQVAIAAAV